MQKCYYTQINESKKMLYYSSSDGTCLAKAVMDDEFLVLVV